MADLDPSEAARLIEAIRSDPLFFIKDVLGGEPDAQQEEIIRAFPGARRIGVKSGHSCGKDWLSARLALWFHLAHFPGIVVTTGPTDRQVRKVVWGEIKAAYMGSRIPIGGTLLDTALKSNHPHHYMIGYTADTPEAFQGFHAENVLVVVTEAQGVEARMWPGIESLLTAPNSKLLLIGNATYEPDSEFYSAFTSRAAQYATFTLDSTRSPHCSKRWVEEMLETHGAESPVYLARVKGVFPTDIADTLIPLGWIERARERWASRPNDYSSLTLGVDVARFGSDHTCIYLGRGDSYQLVHDAQGQDLMQTCGRVVQLIGEHTIPPENVRLDDTGLGGGVTDRLKELGKRITPINFGGGPLEPDKDGGPANARMELFWALRERFREGNISIDPRDGKLLRDLSVLRYKQQSNGKLKLEEKAEAKRRLGYSPDRADALALAAVPQSIATGVASGGKPCAGLLDFARYELERRKKDNSAANPVSSSPVEGIPGAAEILGGRQ
jgi:hypothetical protein